MNQSVIHMSGLIKRYGGFTALNGINLDIQKGEVFGILGPNGAGKTTMLECLEGLRKKSGGTLRVAGYDPEKDRMKLRFLLGVQLQTSSLPDYIRVEEALELFTSFSHSEKDEQFLEKFGIKELLKKQYKDLSTGQKRRVNLALALVKKPEIVILDEPTAGLDVQSRAELHDEIRKIKTEGMTVLLATHDMAEAEALCDRIAILMNGNILITGTPEEVTASGSKETRIRLRTANGSLLPGKDIPGAAFIKEKDDYLEYRCNDIATAATALLSLIDPNDSVEDLRVERPSLEERFLELVKRG